jgi:hypothetical protein
MDKFLLIVLDKFLIFFHTLLILFNLFGWAWKRTRKLNLIILLLVAFSWLVLGIWYGIGYCPLTDLHWNIKISLGQTDLPNSYIKYLVDYYFNLDSDPILIDCITAISFFIALIISTYLNFFLKSTSSSLRPGEFYNKFFFKKRKNS